MGNEVEQNKNKNVTELVEDSDILNTDSSNDNINISSKKLGKDISLNNNLVDSDEPLENNKTSDNSSGKSINENIVDSIENSDNLDSNSSTSSSSDKSVNENSDDSSDDSDESDTNNSTDSTSDNKNESMSQNTLLNNTQLNSEAQLEDDK